MTSSFPNYSARLPIFRVRSIPPSTLVTVQIPMEPTCGFVPTSDPNDCDFGSRVIVLNVQQNGVPGPDFPLNVRAWTPHIMTTCDTVIGGSGAVYCPTPNITHADGSLVGTGCGYPLNHPVMPGETIVIYAVGLGPTTPSVKTGEPRRTRTVASTNHSIGGCSRSFEFSYQSIASFNATRGSLVCRCIGIPGVRWACSGLCRLVPDQPQSTGPTAAQRCDEWLHYNADCDWNRLKPVTIPHLLMA